MTAQAGARIHLGFSHRGFIGGAMLIVLGTLLFFDNLGILPFSVFVAFRPLFFMGIGAYGFFRCGGVVLRIWSAAAFLAGVLLALGAFRIVHVTMATLWPLALIAIGAVMLVSRLNWTTLTDTFNIGSSANSRTLATRLSEVAVFSGVKRRIEAQNFEGGELSSVFGGIEVDLRRAGISTDGKVAVLEANAAFGAVELRIPENWRLSMQGTAVFGAYEDKTIPPRPEPGVETPTLVIKGGTAFGAVIVRN
jgi:predicted membrane protein